MPNIVRYFTIILITAFFVSTALRAEEVESAFFQAYDKFYEVASEFKNTLVQLIPPEGFQYSEEDLQEYQQLLSALFEEKPEYQSTDLDELKFYKEAKELAQMTGLPHRELAIYQRGNGTHGLRNLLYSVKNLQNIQWVSWYMVLIDGTNLTVEEFLDDASEDPQLITLRTEYGEQSAHFNQTYDILLANNALALQTTSDIPTKNHLVVKAYIYRYIAGKAGKVWYDGFSESRAGYPLTNAIPERFPEAVALAKKLEVNFYDLAFIQQKNGTMGLRSVIGTMSWLDTQGIIAEIFTPADWQRVMNWAELSFPELFPIASRRSMEIPPAFQVRYYSASNVYLGYNTEDGFFYGYSSTLWGASVQKFGALNDYLPLVE